MTNTQSITVLVAGSTQRTQICAQVLCDDDRFRVVGIVTPTPKPIGRKQTITPNPLHIFANENQIPTIIVEKKLDTIIQEQIGKFSFDILLVVDFGYIIPPWLLAMPTLAPVNIHPSDLPKYRGSSPGQFCLLFGETTSAVTFMVMDAKLDHGPIIAKLPFAVEQKWTTEKYYAQAFELVKENLGDALISFIANPEKVAPQPDESPTPTARMLKREDGYIPYQALQELTQVGSSTTAIPFLESYSLPTSASQVMNMFRAFHPWPGLWTTKTIAGKEKRVKILDLNLMNEKIEIDAIQVEGKTPQSWREIQ